MTRLNLDGLEEGEGEVSVMGQLIKTGRITKGAAVREKFKPERRMKTPQARKKPHTAALLTLLGGSVKYWQPSGTDMTRKA